MNKDKVNNEEILSEDMNPIKVEVEDDESTVSIVDPVEEANKKVEEYKDLTQRLQAEFDNFRKRNAESTRIARNDGINDVIISLLPVLDDFERGINATENESAKSGMELIYKKIVNLLNKYDAVEIEALGAEFDPQYHHAIAQCEDAENNNKVVEVFQKGYQRKDKVLRPAMVKVAQ